MLLFYSRRKNRYVDFHYAKCIHYYVTDLIVCLEFVISVDTMYLYIFFPFA